MMEGKLNGKSLADEVASAIWRFKIYYEGYGTYTDIDWAVKKHILTPYEHPKRTARIRKWLIKKFGPSLRGECEK